ncbi:ABC transporter permease [Pseudoalteromonas fenneropenaei]|uniref:ABC transporter permease n=1 Tax=Pseudoalteromonas fenneropenaei TaxID=1737459 RepID=A0ABV7CGA8_9GAMM
MFEIGPIFNALRRSKVGAILLLIQIAITTAIVSNAAFIIQDRLQYLQQETGYPEQDLFSFSVMTFGQDVDLSQQFELDETMLRQLPGVVDASITSVVPLSGSGSASGFNLKPAPEQSKNVRAAYIFADEHMLSTLGVELIAGRNFTQDEVVIAKDLSKLPNVGLVTQAFLDEMFPEGDGLGQTIYLGDKGLTIIGVIKQASGPWLKDSRPNNLVIIPFVQASAVQEVIVRTEPGQRQAVMAQIEDLMLNAYDKRVLNWVKGLDEQKADYNAGDTLMMRMLIVLIVVLILVTALGIFGLTLFNISKRTKQIGTRRALGARKSAIIRYFLVENVMICLVGLLLGGAGAVYLGQQLMAHYSIPQLQLVYVFATAIAVLLMTIIAVFGPAKRAADISPSIATRSI